MGTLRTATVVLVTISAGLVTLQADAGPLVVLAALGGGFVAGAVLAWIAFPAPEETDFGPRRPR